MSYEEEDTCQKEEKEEANRMSFLVFIAHTREV
jgi:hypothetical protein